MNYELFFEPDVDFEIEDAFNWLEKQDKGLGTKFIAELETYFEKISAHPEYFSFFKNHLRHAILPTFSYKIVYEVADVKIIVHAVFHTSRRPKNF